MLSHNQRQRLLNHNLQSVIYFIKALTQANNIDDNLKMIMNASVGVFTFSKKTGIEYEADFEVNLDALNQAEYAKLGGLMGALNALREKIAKKIAEHQIIDIEPFRPFIYFLRGIQLTLQKYEEQRGKQDFDRDDEAHRDYVDKRLPKALMELFPEAEKALNMDPNEQLRKIIEKFYYNLEISDPDRFTCYQALKALNLEPPSNVTGVCELINKTILDLKNHSLRSELEELRDNIIQINQETQQHANSLAS